MRRGVIIDDTSVVVSEGSESFVRNELVLPRLAREHLLMELVCQASQSNTDYSANHTAYKAVVKLELNLKPLEVLIMSANKPLSAGIRAEVKCRASGSRPQPQISWYKGSKKMPEVRDSASNDGNATISTLSFIPAIEDNGKHLSCRADNEQMADDEIESGRILTIYCLYTTPNTLATNSCIF
ncbi:unnamed protein product [Medioppia subpectinata]|uniref:Ig-like domain-containing protein n=1 Tax=Medioppia subpectinata TaxID=1979941 RepID=A0A7R9KXK4_9ACAR|nr:unnamed protein product [Medioppia subpectinata]CAG2111509.1 unnamed protein product [Medioppia subpectinata]